MGAPTFYRRPIPDGLIVFSSAEGKALFREALADGTMESFFALSEQFHTQAEPAFCALGSLVVALNALAIDPGRLWKGPWRWFDESLLDCCVPLDVVAARGVTLSELACLAECNGARAKLTRAAEGGVDAFREEIVRASRSAGERVVIVGYHRGALGQTGTGHYSPIGGYHARTDRALLLDVARFKYPPHWVSVEQLFAAMATVDEATGKPRGWVTLERSDVPRPLFVRLGVPITGWRAILDALRSDVGPSASAVAWASAIARSEPARAAILAPLAVAMGAELAEQHRTYVDALVLEVRETPEFRAAMEGMGPSADPRTAAVAAVLGFVLGGTDALLGPALRTETAAVRRQLEALCPGI
ncbi:MAG: phytochelatin synthase family protein [Polyangiaceae bacterium]